MKNLEPLQAHDFLQAHADALLIDCRSEMEYLFVGHPQGACGAAGLAATVLLMRQGFAHPTINLTAPDPQCDLDYIPVEARKLRINAALCNCIAFGSKNSALIVTLGS